jgi:FKBP-type peptidyl-prolyl cis-trans isomerase
MQKSKRILGNLLLSVVIIILLSSCLGTDADEEVRETTQIQEYLTKNPTIGFVRKESGLYYANITTGTGLPARTHDTAYAFYTVKLLSGTELESNFGTTDTLIFAVNEGIMIAAFDEGITYMNVGGKSMLLTPSSLAYGANGNYFGNIGGYTPLLIDIKLLKVVPAAVKK